MKTSILNLHSYFMRRVFVLLLGVFNCFVSINATQNNAFKMHQIEDIENFPMIMSLENDTILDLSNESASIYGLSVSMDITKKNPDFLVRLVLEDINGSSFLVAEQYKEISDPNRTFQLVDFCEETSLLNGIVPQKLRIYIKNASVQLHSIKIGKHLSRDIRGMEDLKRVVDEKRLSQAEEKVNLINSFNSENCGLWLAGVTSLSLKDYDTRQRILGISESVPSGGIEFYTDGIFVFPSANPNQYSESALGGVRAATTSSVVSRFSWKNRHGKNWLTSVKDQGNSGYCSAFSAISCTEALVNLYFNQNVDLDLSEQQAACCNGDSNPWTGMSITAPLNYIKNHGVYDETAYPFVNDSAYGMHCYDASVNPTEIVTISNYTNVSTNHEDSVKKALIKYGPLSSGFRRVELSGPLSGHAMSIIGYFDIHVGDTLQAVRHYTGCNYCWGLDTVIIVEDKEYKQIGNIIGKTCWVFKNSGLDVPYMNILFQDLGGMQTPYRLDTPITWMTKANSIYGVDYYHTDVVCEDVDGDGYYFWGIGGKPSNCPSWVPIEADGDDSDYSKGKMLEAPVFGELEVLNPDGSTTQTISSNTTYTTRQHKYTHLRITNNATLTVKDILNFLGRTTITIDSGAQLTIDGGTVTNACFNIASGGKLTLKNGGKLIMRTNTDLNIPVGAIADISNGEILRSSDF